MVVAGGPCHKQEQREFRFGEHGDQVDCEGGRVAVMLTATTISASQCAPGGLRPSLTGYGDSSDQGDCCCGAVAKLSVTATSAWLASPGAFGRASQVVVVLAIREMVVVARW